MKIILGIVAALSVFCLTPARANLIYTFSYSGEITQLDFNAGLFGVGATVGDTFTGTFSYIIGAANPDQAPGDPEVAGYDVLSATVDGTALTLDPSLIVVRHAPGIPTLPPLPPSVGQDAFGIRLAPGGGVYSSGVRLNLLGEFEDAFTDDSLPTGFDLGDFMTAEIAGRGPLSLDPMVPTAADRGLITSISLLSIVPLSDIPLPAAFWIFLAGAAGLSRVRARTAA